MSSSLTCKCRFLDHTLSCAAAHGELRIYFDGNVIVFNSSSSSSLLSSTIPSLNQPKSLSELHTIITFSSMMMNTTDRSASSSSLIATTTTTTTTRRSPSPASTSTPSSTTMIFCFYKGDGTATDLNSNYDIAIECESLYEVKTIGMKLFEAKSNNNSNRQSSSSSSPTTTPDFVWMKYNHVEQVVRYLRLRDGNGTTGGDTNTNTLLRPIPFPHTRLDFLKLASNRSVQCKLSSLGDSSIELTCDGIHALGWLTCNQDHQQHHQHQQQHQNENEDRIEFSSVTFRDCIYDVLKIHQYQQQGNDDNNLIRSTTTTTENYFTSNNLPTMVVIMSDQAIYLTENTGRVRGRLAYSDITELVSIPESSALFINTRTHHIDGGLTSLGTVLVSRFCPDIFSRITMSGKLIHCVPVTTSMDSISGDMLLSSSNTNDSNQHHLGSPPNQNQQQQTMNQLQNLADSIERNNNNNNNNKSSSSLSTMTSPLQQQQRNPSSASVAINLSKHSPLRQEHQQQQLRNGNNSNHNNDTSIINSPQLAMIISTCDFATQTEDMHSYNDVVDDDEMMLLSSSSPSSVKNGNNNNNSNNVDHSSSAFLLSPPPTSYHSFLRAAAEQGEDDDDDDEDDNDNTDDDTMKKSKTKRVNNNKNTKKIQEYYYAVALYWMNQSKRLQDCLSRREITLKMQHQRYESLAQSVNTTTKQPSNVNNNNKSSSQSSLSSSSLQREVEVLRHYTRLLEDELIELRGAELQERLIELASKTIPPVTTNNATPINKQQNKVENKGDKKDTKKKEIEEKEEEEAFQQFIRENNTKALKLALLDSRRQQAALTRKCNRLQAELQSVMINTDAALKEVTAFVADTVMDMSSSSTKTKNRNTNKNGTENQEEEANDDTDTDSIPYIVRRAVQSLEEYESKVQTESAIKCAELKALNASLVVELRSREQELETIVEELTRAGDMSAVSPRTRKHLLNTVVSGANGTNSNNSTTTTEDLVAQQSFESKQRALARQINDLQLLKERLTDELAHLLERVDNHQYLRALQDRIDVLEKLHHFPLIINRVATLESIAKECEEVKLESRSLKTELEDKRQQLAKRSAHYQAMEMELVALKKKLQQAQHAAIKEQGKREEAEKKAAEAAQGSEASIKELRKQVRYHQLRVQELLKRVHHSNNQHHHDDSNHQEDNDTAVVDITNGENNKNDAENRPTTTTPTTPTTTATGRKLAASSSSLANSSMTTGKRATTPTTTNTIKSPSASSKPKPKTSLTVRKQRPTTPVSETVVISSPEQFGVVLGNNNTSMDTSSSTINNHNNNNNNSNTTGPSSANPVEVARSRYAEITNQKRRL